MKTELLDQIFPEGGVKDGVVASFNYNSTHSEYLALKDAAEADAAFRATIVELCDKHGMPPGAYPYLYLARRLEERDGTQVSRLADVAANYGIGEGEKLADFLLSKCKLVDRLYNQLEETQHCLAEAESDVPDEDEVCACAMDSSKTLEVLATKQDLYKLGEEIKQTNTNLIAKRNEDYRVAASINDLKENVGMVADDIEIIGRQVVNTKASLDFVRQRVRHLTNRPSFGFIKSYISALAALATFAAAQYLMR